MKTFFQFLLLVLILSNIWFIIKIKNIRLSLKRCELNELNSNASLSAAINLQISSFNYTGEVFKGEKGVVDSLLKNIGNSPKLFLSFNEFSCESCILRAFNDLDSIGQIIGNKNIIILTRYQNKRESVFLSKRFGDRFKVFNTTPENKFFFDDENFITRPPNFFIMDEKMICSLFFYYSINYSNLNKGYFNAVINYFNNFNNLKLKD